jgi:hypothetical protein
MSTGSSAKRILFKALSLCILLVKTSHQRTVTRERRPNEEGLSKNIGSIRLTKHQSRKKIALRGLTKQPGEPVKSWRCEQGRKIQMLDEGLSYKD